jgi:hypothetical protein
MDERLLEADRQIERGEPDEAATICSLILNDEPDNQLALFTMARCFSTAARYGLSVTLYRRLVELNPSDSAYHNNLGFALHSIGNYEEAEREFLTAIDLDGGNWHAYNNMTTLMASRSRADDALEWGKKALFFGDAKQQKDTEKNLSLPLLGTSRWKRGWQAFDANLGDPWRLDKHYGDAPYWDGKPGQTVVFHGEQGIGDEILFASMLDEACRDTHCIIDCDARLAGLFQRSFPRATVYGTRHDKGESAWHRLHDIEAKCAFGSLGKFYRNRAQDFPRERYLLPCPTRRKMYRSLLDQMPGKKVGVAWTGGTKTTRMKDRSLSTDDIAAFCSKFPQHSFISLEYKGPDAPYPLHQWSWATRSNDYDDTAALVAELDCIISVTTAVALLAGALGCESHVLVPSEPTWHWGYDGEIPWFPLNLYRGELKQSLERIGEVVCG